jgi:hypothetical protein
LGIDIAQRSAILEEAAPVKRSRKSLAQSGVAKERQPAEQLWIEHRIEQCTDLPGGSDSRKVVRGNQRAELFLPARVSLRRRPIQHCLCGHLTCTRMSLRPYIKIWPRTFWLSACIGRTKRTQPAITSNTTSLSRSERRATKCWQHSRIRTIMPTTGAGGRRSSPASAEAYLRLLAH